VETASIRLASWKKEQISLQLLGNSRYPCNSLETAGILLAPWKQQVSVQLLGNSRYPPSPSETAGIRPAPWKQHISL